MQADIPRIPSRALPAVLAAIALVLLAAAPARALATALPDGTPDEVAQAVEAYVAGNEETTAGLAVAVVTRDGEAYRQSFGYESIEDGRPVADDTVFEWGSATKLLVWVSVMQLVERGDLDLDADVRAYLPVDVALRLDFTYPVTLRNLMNHEAGFQEMPFDVFAADDGYPRELSEAMLAHVPAQVYEPGTVTAYSNWGCALAAYVVECRSGQDFADYVHEHIFEPLGMRHSALLPDLSDNAWVAGQRARLQCYVNRIPLGTADLRIPLYPAGMCTSTVGDFALFAQALLQEDGPLFQASAGRAALLEPTSFEGQTGIVKNRHGFWEFQLARPLTGHGGNTAGCSSRLVLDLEGGTGVVVMTNQAGEQVYNEGLVEELYGPFDEDALLPGREPPGGMWRTARTVLAGPAKILSASYLVVDESQRGEFWVHDGSSGLGRICMPYADLLEVPLLELAVELCLLVLWAAGVAASAAYLAIAGIRILVRMVRRAGPDPAAGIERRLRLAAAGVQMAAFLLAAAGVTVISSYGPAGWFQAICAAIAITAVAMAVLAAALVRKQGKVRPLNVFACAFLVVAVANILYWNLFMFWAV